MTNLVSLVCTPIIIAECVFIYVYTYIHIYTHRHAHAYVQKCMRAFACVCVCQFFSSLVLVQRIGFSFSWQIVCRGRAAGVEPEPNFGCSLIGCRGTDLSCRHIFLAI